MTLKSQTNRHIKRGQKVFSENDKSKDLYFIEGGSIKILKLKNGKQMELAVLGKGSIFGEMAMLDGKPRSATALASEDSDLVVVTENEFNKKIENVPKWYIALIRVTSERLRLLNDRLNNNHRLQNISNVAHLLVLIIKKHKRDFHKGRKEGANIEIDMKFVKKEIIQILGLNKSSLSESLDFLEKKNFILQFSNNVTINDQVELLNYSRFLRSYNGETKIVLLNDDLRMMLTDLKNILDKSFAKSEVVTFSHTNIETELQKNTQVPEGKEDWFLNTINKMKIIKFIQSDGSNAMSIQQMDPNGQISIDSTYLTKILAEESFKRLGF